MITIAFQFFDHYSYFISKNSFDKSSLIEISAPFFTYLSLVIRFYQILVSCHILTDYLIALNPFVWPISLLSALVRPFFLFWNTIFPVVKIGPFYLELGSVFAFKAISFLTKLPKLLRKYYIYTLLEDSPYTEDSGLFRKENINEAENTLTMKIKDLHKLIEQPEEKNT